MNDLYEDSVHLITSSQDNNTNFGTGFVIHRKGVTSHVLTCRHVLDDVGGEEYALVDGNPVVKAVINPIKGPDDMAVLVVDNQSSPVFKLKKATRSGLSFIVCGFYALDSKTEKCEIQRVIGITEGPTWHKLKKSKNRVKTWRLNIESEHTLQPGYSGSPVIDEADGAVIGMVNLNFRLSKKKGVAIAVETLMDVWPDMPKGLIIAPTNRKETLLRQEKEHFPSFIVKLCNRDRHDSDFRDTFVDACHDQTCSHHPQFYIIHGNAWECHDSFVERMLNTHIKNFTDQEWKEKKLKREAIIVNFPEHDELESHKNRLAQELIISVNANYFQKDVSLSAFCSQPNLEGYDVVVINHHIHASKWNKYFGSLLKWYMGEFWSFVNLPQNAPLFIIFMSIIYKDTVKSWRQRIKAKRTYKKVRKTIDEIQASVKDTCRCLVLKEIGPLCQEDILNWFKKKETPFFEESEIKAEIDLICPEGTCRSMAEVEKRLKEIIGNLDHNMFKNSVWGA
jgi:menaquinone-dependent protoporphyrinogen IX oxidase